MPPLAQVGAVVVVVLVDVVVELVVVVDVVGQTGLHRAVLTLAKPLQKLSQRRSHKALHCWGGPGGEQSLPPVIH